MDVRTAAFDAVAAKMTESVQRLAPLHQAILRKANANGMSGGVVVELVDEYKKRMTQLGDYCVEQYEWEAKHAIGFRSKRYEEWRGVTVDSLRTFATACLAEYTASTRNIAVLNSHGVFEAFKSRLNSAEEEVRISATTLLQKKAAEVNSSTVRGGLDLLKKGALAGGSAVAGYLWHKYFG